MAVAFPTLSILDAGSVITYAQQSWTDGLQPGSGQSSVLSMVTGKARPAQPEGNRSTEEHPHRELQELSWADFSLNSRQRWESRVDERSPHHPGFRHKTSNDERTAHMRYWLRPERDAWSPSTSRAGGGGVCREAKYEGNSLVKALNRHCEDGELEEGVEALDLLVQRGLFVKVSLFYRVLKLCKSQKDLVLARRVHVLASKCGYESNAFLATHIVGMYASHGRLEEASYVFTKVPAPDSHLWATVILAHAQHGKPVEAINLYRRMRGSCVKPDNHIFAAVLKACSLADDVVSGTEVHDDILASDHMMDIYVGNSLVNMYAKCGSLKDARRVFDALPTADVVTLNTMIAGYVHQGLAGEALALYERRQQDSLMLTNHVTFVCLLKACASLGALQQGKQFHAQIEERGLGADELIGNCLVDMYAKCGSLEDARRVFDRLPSRTVVTWNSMIAGCTQHGLGEEALALYSTMQQEAITLADRVTFVCLLQACASTGALHRAKQLHVELKQRGLEADLVVANCIVDMYAKCGSLEDAREVFDSLPTRDVVTWTTMIAGYSQQGRGQEALCLYASMQQEGITPANQVTFVCLLQACASVGALRQGKELHARIQEMGLEADVSIGSCLVDMYAKCGSLQDARRVFDRLPSRNVVTWSAMLNGYAEHSKGEMALQCFREMLEEGVQPDDTTFICLLVACSHAGLVNEGQQCFRAMVTDHGILPSDDHHRCMIDLLGRAGHLDEAEAILRTMPRDVVGWTSLLTACKRHSDAERGKLCFDRLVSLQPENATPYVLLGNIYGNSGRWTDVDKVESLRRAAGAWKRPAKACIEVNNKVHEFKVGEERSEVSTAVRSVNSRLKGEGGHVPQTQLVLKAVSEQEKEDALCGHAEKLALAYGLMNTPKGATLLVNKNLRMCNDCHSSTKIMSRLERREIIVRDAHGVHHFVDGSCSCRDKP